ncbi:MAG: hypothetical protein ACE5H0_08640, partial [Bacteroidota bacterium]
MKREVRSVISLLFILFVSESFCQDRSRLFQVTVDYARFRGDSARAYLELCYSFLEQQLMYVPEGDTYRGQVLFEVTITPEGQADPVVRRAWLTPHVVADTASLMDDKSPVGVEGFGVEPGRYWLKLFAQDTNDKI